jgi:hypothetical protein
MRRKQRENEKEKEDFCPPSDRVFLNVVKKSIEECGGSRGRMRMRTLREPQASFSALFLILIMALRAPHLRLDCRLVLCKSGI